VVFRNKHLHAGPPALISNAMAFYKGLFSWLIISLFIGWGAWRTTAPEGKESWWPIIIVTLGFIVLVAVTGCKVDEDHGDHEHAGH
jgi:uncharacterized membrane protein